MTKESKIINATTLYNMGVQLNEAFAEGYTITPGWPIQIGYYYEVKIEREPKAPVGRPKKEKE